MKVRFIYILYFLMILSTFCFAQYNGWYNAKIVDKNLQATGAANSATANAVSPTTEFRQQWQLVAASNGSHEIINRQTATYLCVQAGTASAVSLQMNTKPEPWKVVPISNALVAFKHENTGRYMAYNKSTKTLWAVTSTTGYDWQWQLSKVAVSSNLCDLNPASIIKVGTTQKSVASNGSLALATSDALKYTNGNPAYDIRFTLQELKGVNVPSTSCFILWNDNVVAVLRELSLKAYENLAIQAQAYLTPGTGKLKIVCDSYNQMDEGNEANNSIIVTLIVPSQTSQQAASGQTTGNQQQTQSYTVQAAPTWMKSYASLKSGFDELQTAFAGMANTTMANSLGTQLQNYVTAAKLLVEKPTTSQASIKFTLFIYKIFDGLSKTPDQISMLDILQKIGERFDQDIVAELNKNELGKKTASALTAIVISDPTIEIGSGTLYSELLAVTVSGKIMIGSIQVNTSFRLSLFSSNGKFFGLPVPIGLMYRYELANTLSLSEIIGLVSKNATLASNLQKADVIRCTGVGVCVSSHEFYETINGIYRTMKSGINIYGIVEASGYLQEARQKWLALLKKVSTGSIKFEQDANSGNLMLNAWIAFDIKAKKAGMGFAVGIPLLAGFKVWEGQSREFGLKIESLNLSVEANYNSSGIELIAAWKDVYLIKLPYNSTQLTFIRSYAIDALDLELSFAATMKGKWQNAFGISGLTLGSDDPAKGFAIQIALSLNAPYLTNIGCAGIGSINTGTSTTEIFFGWNVDVLDVKKSGVYFNLNQTPPFEDIIAALNKIAGLARKMLANTDKAIFDGELNLEWLTKAIKKLKELKNCPEIRAKNVTFRIGLSRWNVGEIYFPMGFELSGELYFRSGDRTKEWTALYSAVIDSSGLLLEAVLPKIEIKDFLTISDAKSDSEGPNLKIALRKDEQMIKISGKLEISKINLSSVTDVDISSSGCSVNLSTSLFNLEAEFKLWSQRSSGMSPSSLNDKLDLGMEASISQSLGENMDEIVTKVETKINNAKDKAIKKLRDEVKEKKAKIKELKKKIDDADWKDYLASRVVSWGLQITGYEIEIGVIEDICIPLVRETFEAAIKIVANMPVFHSAEISCASLLKFVTLQGNLKIALDVSIGSARFDNIEINIDLHRIGNMIEFISQNIVDKIKQKFGL